MTLVLIQPRIEDPGSTAEPVQTTWWYRVRPSRTVTGEDWVIDEWPPLRQVSATPADLDHLDIAYELEVYRGDDLTKPRLHEFRMVPDSVSTLKWQLLEQVSGPGSAPPVTTELEARVAALESSHPSGGASDVSEVAGISLFSRTYLDDTSADAVLTTLGAAAAADLTSGLAAKAPLASPALTGNPTAPTQAPGDSDTSIATTAFVAAAIAALGTIVSVPAVTGLTLRLTYRTTDVAAARPTVPSGVSINWEVPGDTEPTNIRWDLGDVWTSVYS